MVTLEYIWYRDLKFSRAYGKQMQSLPLAVIWNPIYYKQRRAQGELEKIVEMWKYSFVAFMI